MAEITITADIDIVCNGIVCNRCGRLFLDSEFDLRMGRLYITPCEDCEKDAIKAALGKMMTIRDQIHKLIRRFILRYVERSGMVFYLRLPGARGRFILSMSEDEYRELESFRTMHWGA